MTAGPSGPMCAGISFAYPCMLSQCHTNVLNALTNRHLTKPKNSCDIHLVNPFLTVYKKLARGIAFDMYPALEAGEWRVGKTTHKLQNIDTSRLYDRAQPNKAKSFAKREVNVAVPSKARLIQGNQNELTAYEHPAEYGVMNAIMKSLQGHEFECRGVACRFVYAGGMNHDALSDLFSEESNRPGNILYDERDGKNWDSTMNFSLLNAEAQVYEMLKLKSASRFLQRCAKVIGTVRTKVDGVFVLVKYLTAWKRLSGDWNTSVGNTIISMIIVYTVINHLPEHLLPRRWCGLFMGDDYLAILNYGKAEPPQQPLHDALSHYESLCGITPVRALFKDPLAVSFISLTPWPRFNGGYQFVPNPGKQLAKLFWAKDSKYKKRAEDYASTIARSFWTTFHGFPLMMAFLKFHFRARAKLVALDRYVTEPLTQASREVNWRQGFVYKYRIPYSALDFEFPNEVAVWHHPAVRHMIEIESLDPQDRHFALTH